MKKSSILGILLIVNFVLPVSPIKAQADVESIKNCVASQHFIFKAQTALPSGGASRLLEADYYDVRVQKDSLAVFLPYFGRAYSITNYPSDGGIQFTSTKFDYKWTKGKKAGWDISIKPKDARDIRELTINVSENGTADLKIISDNRQPISFLGYITTLK
jgi:hypothetical protein